jgi:hypothetical protein
MSIRNCSTCKYLYANPTEPPCSECDYKGSHWELIEEQDATPSSGVRNDTVSSAVNHPQHYNHGKYECIDVMVENFGKEAVQHFCLLNAFKYVWRTNYKNGVEDVRKAMKYLDFYLSLCDEND